MTRVHSGAVVLSLTWLLLATAPLLGTPLVEEGFSFQPPETFRSERLELFQGSEVLAISDGTPATPRRLTAVLRDGEGADASVLLIASVAAPLSATPTGRDAFVLQVVSHFAALGLDFALERAALVSGDVPRVEVFGSVKQQGALRSLLISGIPGETQHVVVTLSTPTRRLESLLPPVRASLASFQVASPPSSLFSRRLFGAVAGALAGALIVSLAFWRKRRRVS